MSIQLNENGEFTWQGHVCQPWEGWGQYHPGKPWMYYDPECVTIDKMGRLILSIRRVPKMFITPEGKELYVPNGIGMCRIVEPFGMGTFTTRMKLPKGIGLWPAWWMYNNTKDEKAMPEIDMIEGYSDDTDYRVTSCLGKVRPWRIESCLHLNPDFKLGQFPPRRPAIEDFNANPADYFLTYRLFWSADILVFYIEGVPVRVISDPKLLNHLKNYRLMMLFNTGITGEYRDKFTIDETNPMIVDYFLYMPL